MDEEKFIKLQQPVEANPYKLMEGLIEHMHSQELRLKALEDMLLENAKRGAEFSQAVSEMLVQVSKDIPQMRCDLDKLMGKDGSTTPP